MASFRHLCWHVCSLARLEKWRGWPGFSICSGAVTGFGLTGVFTIIFNFLAGLKELEAQKQLKV